MLTSFFSGNLSSLQGLPLTNLDLTVCELIEGRLCEGVRTVGVASRQHLNVSGTFFAILVGLVVCSNPILHLIFFFLGDLSSLASLTQLTKLDLAYCKLIKGRVRVRGLEQ